MDRFTISLDAQLASAFDELIEQRGYTTRSEAVRDILRELRQREDSAAIRREDHCRAGRASRSAEPRQCRAGRST
jgi:CopG family transcriptional regulator, nickel-responsive regulator